MGRELVLIEYDKACRQLARARSVDEVAKIMDGSVVLRACAKVAKNKQLEADAWEIRVRAERRLGEMMENGKADRAREGKRVLSKPVTPPTLAEIGINKGLAHRARRLYELSDKDFGLMVIDGRADVEHAAERSRPTAKKKPRRKLVRCPTCGLMCISR